MRWPPWWRVPAAPPDHPDCVQVAEILQSFLDGELPAADAELVALHVEGCERCHLEFRVVREVLAVIRRQRPDLDPAPLARLRVFAAEVPATVGDIGAG